MNRLQGGVNLGPPRGSEQKHQGHVNPYSEQRYPHIGPHGHPGEAGEDIGGQADARQKPRPEHGAHPIVGDPGGKNLSQLFPGRVFRYASPLIVRWRSGGMIDFKGSQFEKEIILWGVRWYGAYPISYRQLEEIMDERGVAVDHSTLNRWVIKYALEFEKQFRRHQHPVGRSWRLDETYVKIKGKWAYLYRAMDKEGHTIDFLLIPIRDRDAAEAFLRKAIRTQGLPEKITIDKSGANTTTIKHYNKTQKTAIIIRHAKYLNNIVEQDHRAVKRLTRPMLGFKSFWAACCTIAGMEVRHAIRKGQLTSTGHAP
jgi:transposase-like protein